MGWQLHQQDHMQIICILLQTDNHASTSSLDFFYRLDALPATQSQCQSTEGNKMLQKLRSLTDKKVQNAMFHQKHTKLSYHTGTTRHAMSVDILLTAAQMHGNCI